MTDGLTKRCPECCESLPLDSFSRDVSTRDKLRRICRGCAVVKQREYRKRSKSRACPSCRRTLTADEPDGRCGGCDATAAGRALKAGLPARLGRPGCIVYKRTALVPVVLGEDDGRWLVMSVKNCKVCGVDQHLETCLDCTDPVGGGDKQKSIRPLEPCAECGEFTPGGGKCYHCS